MIDPVEFGKQIALIVKEATAPLLKRIEQLENVKPDTVTIDVDQIAKAAAELIPVPKDGKDGLDGADGKDGLDGSDGLIGQKGADGVNGRDGKDGKDGESVSAETVIASVSASFERRFSDMQLSWERQARDTFEKAVDRIPIPKDGVNGKDALPVESIGIVQDGRDVVIKLGDTKHVIKLDTVIDRGVWREAEYEKGDAVTYGGSLWIAQDSGDHGAPGTSKAWRLAVKKGRDGKDLRDNASVVDKSKGVKV